MNRIGNIYPAYGVWLAGTSARIPTHQPHRAPDTVDPHAAPGPKDTGNPTGPIQVLGILILAPSEPLKSHRSDSERDKELHDSVG